MSHRLSAVDGASARGDDAVAKRQPEQNLRFDLAESEVPFVVHDRLQSFSGRALNEEIGVHEIARFRPSYQLADGALPGPRHALPIAFEFPSGFEGTIPWKGCLYGRTPAHLKALTTQIFEGTAMQHYIDDPVQNWALFNSVHEFFPHENLRGCDEWRARGGS